MNLKKLMLLILILSNAMVLTSCDSEEVKNQIIKEINDSNTTDGGVRDNLPEPFPNIETYLNQITNPPTASCCDTLDNGVDILPAEVSGVVLDSNGQPIEKAEVRVLKQAVYTNAKGEFSIKDIDGNQSVVVNFYHKDYMTNSRILFAAEDSKNHIEQKMHTQDTKKILANGDEISLMTDSGAKVLTNYNPNVVKDGKYYQGKIEAALSYLHLKDVDSIMKFLGKYRGEDFYGQDVSFVSYGLVNFELKDENGLKVDLAEGETATLTFPPSSSTSGYEVIPVYSYDYHKGTWKEEGQAHRQPNGTYQAEITHAGVWSLSRPVEIADGTSYRGRIVLPDGSPARNVEVMGTGRYGWMTKDLTTDDDGNFELNNMIPNEPFRLKAYTKDDKHYADYQYELRELSPGEIRYDEK